MSFKELREAEVKQPGADAIDALAELVADRYPKGTQDEYGKALRHQLHKLGRLNEPDPESDFGFIVFFPSRGADDEPNSGWDVVHVPTYQEALEVRGFGHERVIRALEPHGSGTRVLWAKRVKDPRNRNGERGAR